MSGRTTDATPGGWAEWSRSTHTRGMPTRAAGRMSCIQLQAAWTQSPSPTPERDAERVEVGEVRLVRADLLGGHDHVELGRDVRLGLGDQVVVAVGEDREPPAGVAQLLPAPGPTSSNTGIVVQVRTKASSPSPLELDPERVGRPPQPLGQDMPIGVRRALRLEDQLLLVVGVEQFAGALPRGGPRGIPHAGPPVDQRAVAVECHPAFADHRPLLHHVARAHPCGDVIRDGVGAVAALHGHGVAVPEPSLGDPNTLIRLSPYQAAAALLGDPNNRSRDLLP